MSTRIAALLTTLCALSLAAAPAALAADAAPPTRIAAAAPSFGPGEQIDWVVEFVGIRAGTARVQVGRPEGDIWPVIAQAKTDGVAKLFEIREHFVTYWDMPNRLPRGSHLEAREIGDHLVERTRYDRDEGKARVEYSRRGKHKQKVVDVPIDVHDFPSAIFWLRTQPLEPGQRYTLPVFTGSRTFMLEAEVVKRETVKTRAGEFQAVKVAAKLGFKDEFKTSNPSEIWFSDDALRIPVKIAADFAVGSVTATLTSYVPGGEMAASR